LAQGSGLRAQGLGLRAGWLRARCSRPAARCSRLARGTKFCARHGIIPDVPPLWGFIAVTVPLVVTPGASTAVVLRNSVSGGIRAGLITTLGVNFGSLMYGFLCAFGFAIALQRWPAVWIVIKIAGITYLAWLGVQSLRHAFNTTLVPDGVAKNLASVDRVSTVQSLREGFLTNAMNPAIATFYFAVLPQFIPRDASIPRTALLLTAVHIALAATCHIAWAIAGGTLSRVLSSGWPRRVLDFAAGAALLILAANLIR
jgi:threonine/homoserine/homoserine lactone efflux protein